MKRFKNSNDSIDLDPYSTSLLDQLLQNQPQWRNIDDIVKLTFRAVADIVHIHSGALKDMKNILTSRASKTELTTGLAIKANVSDLSRAVTQLAAGLDSKTSYEQLQSILKNYVNRTDMQQVLANRAIQEDSRISKKTNKESQFGQINLLHTRMDEFQKQIVKKIAGCATLNQFQDLLTIVEQKANVSEVNEALQGKVSKQYLSTCLQKKINKSEFDQAIIKKAQASDIQLLMNNLEMKVGLNTFEKLTQVVQNKADKTDVQLYLSETNAKIMNDHFQKYTSQRQKSEDIFKQLRSEIQNLKIQFSVQKQSSKKQFQILGQSIPEISQFVNRQKIQVAQESEQVWGKIRQLQTQLKERIIQYWQKELHSEVSLRKKSQQAIYQQIHEVRKRAQQIRGISVLKNQFIDFKSQIIDKLENKIEAQQVQAALNKWQGQINQKMTYDKQQTIELIRNCQRSLTDAITINTNDISSINLLLSKKQQKFQSNLLEQLAKKTRRQVQQCRKTVDILYTEVQGKINIAQYQSDLVEIRKRFDNIVRDINLKANIKDVCVLADSKPNIEDVNKSIRQINSALQEKISQSDLRVVLKDQATINETLCSQNIVGRWLWQTGNLKPAGLVPWEVQCANTVPDYFFWEKDKTSILVLAAGIYQLTACIFSRSGQPGLLVNGQPLGQRLEQTVSVKRSSKRRQKQNVGIRVQQLVMLPIRSRISVNSSVDGCEGFLNIKRL